MDKYIKLKKSDTIKEGDEFWLVHYKIWICISNPFLFGKLYSDAYYFLEDDEFHARRKKTKLKLG